MAASKRYYWIKLKKDFFDIPAIDWLTGQKNGCEYIVLYLKLCLTSANTGGELSSQIGEMLIPFDAEKIARDTKFNIDTVVVALDLFKKLGLIYQQTNDCLYVAEVAGMIGSETESAIRVRRFRERQEEQTKALQCNSNVTERALQSNEEYRDKSIEYRDIDIERESIGGSDEPTRAPKVKKQKYGEYKNVLLTDDEHSKIIAEPNGIEAIEFLSAYIAEKTYKSKSHYLAIKRWVLNAVSERAGKAETKSILDPLMRAAQKEMERSNGKN